MGYRDHNHGLDLRVLDCDKCIFVAALKVGYSFLPQLAPDRLVYHSENTVGRKNCNSLLQLRIYVSGRNKGRMTWKQLIKIRHHLLFNRSGLIANRRYVVQRCV